MEKRDYRKESAELYKPKTGAVVEVDVPEMNFLMADGQGDLNNSKSFSEVTEALYAVSYALKFMVKKGDLQIDYGVMPLEGLWWSDDMATFSVDDKSDWKWTLMIMQPDPVISEMVAAAIDQVRTKKNPVALSLIRFESFKEGSAAQTMHIGPFSEEGPVIDNIHTYIEECGKKRRGRHHEIYLRNDRRHDIGCRITVFHFSGAARLISLR